MKKRDYIEATNNIMEDLELEEVKSVYEMAVMCNSNRQKRVKNHIIKNNKRQKIR